MKNQATKPLKPDNLSENKIKTLTSIVLSLIIGVFAGLIIFALSSSNVFSATQDKIMRANGFDTIKNSRI